MRKALTGIAIVIGGLVVLFGTAFAFAQTQVAKDQIGGLIERRLSEPGREATVEGLAGLIPFDIRLGRFALSDDRGTWLEVDGARVSLAPAELLAGRVKVREAGADRVRIERAPDGPSRPEPASEPFSLPSFPDTLPVFAVDRLYVTALELGRELAGQDATFRLEGNAASGDTGQHLTARIDLDRTDEATANARLRADLDLVARQVDLSLTASETGGLTAGLTGRPDAGSLSVDIAAAGPLDNLTAKVDVDAANLASLDASLALAVEPQPNVDLTGKLAVADGVLPAEIAALLGPDVDVRIKGGQRGPELMALEELGVSARAFTLQGSGTARLDQRQLDGRITFAVPALADASQLAGLPLGGKVELVATAAGDPYQPEVRLDLLVTNLVVDTLRAASVTTQVDVRSLGPLDRGYAGVSLSGYGRADRVTLADNPAPGFADPGWRLSATVPASGDATIEELSVDTGAATAKLEGTIDVATLAGKLHLDLVAPDLARLLASLGPAAPAGLPLAGGLVAHADATVEAGAGAAKATLSLDGNDLSGLPPGAQELIGPAPRLLADLLFVQGQEARIDRMSLTGAGSTLTGDARAGLADSSLGGKLKLAIPQLALLSTVAGQPLKGSALAEVTLGGTFARPGIELSAGADALEIGGQSFRRVALEGRTEGLPDALEGRASLTATQAQGEASLASAFALAGQQLSLKDLLLTAPSTRIAGGLDLDLATLLAAGRVEGRVQDLAALRPWHGQNLAGSIDLRAEMSARQGRQSGVMNVVAKEIGGDFGTLGSLTTEARIDDAFGRGDLDATLRLDSFARPDLSVESARVSAKGALGDLAVTASAKGQQQAPFDLTAAARVRMMAEPRRLDLDKLAGVYAGQTIELRAPARMVLDKGVLDLDQLDLKIGRAQVQGSLRTGRGSVRANATVDAFPLAVLAAFGGPELDGAANARLDLSGSTRAPTLVLTLDVPQLHGDGVSREIPPATLHADLRIDDGRLAAAMRLDKITEAPITASLAAPVNFAIEPLMFDLPPKGALSGRLDGEADLARLVEIAALDGQRMSGPASVALRIDGTVADPRIGGRVELGPARIEDAVTGVLYSDVRLVAVGSGRSIVIEELNGTSRGGGKITGKGELELADDGLPRYALDVSLDNAEVLRNDLGTILTSGQLALRDAGGQARLAGTLDIQRANFQIPGATGPSIPTLDIVEAGSPPAPAAGPARQPFDLVLDVAVNAPARIFVRGRGLDSEWGGSLTAKGPVSTLDVLGKLEFRRGFLDFLDRRFEVRVGEITFDGARPPIPDVNIEATSATTDILAVVKVTGPANRPDLELTSEPALPRDEVMAKLLFSRDLSQITPAQGLRLANAVATLDGGGIDVLGRFREGLGLDTLDVAGQSEDDANLRAGKYVADNVYLEAQQGLQEGTGGLRMQIDITPNLNVSTSVNDASQTGVGVGWKMDY